MTLLLGCSNKKTDDNKPQLIPLFDDVQLVSVLTRDDTIIIEHQKPSIISKLLQGMKEAQPSYIGDPEQSGNFYKLVLTGSGESQTFSVNDLRDTNANLSAKLYAELPGNEHAVAWSLPTAWIQLLLDSKINEEEPRLLFTIDEDSDSVTLVANRDMNQPTLKEAIVSNLSVRSDDDRPLLEYKLDWTDARRAVIRFPNLPQGSLVEFTLDGTETTAGEIFQIYTPQGNRMIAVHEGPAWSGLRWVNTTGKVVREHGFDSAAIIEPAVNKEAEQSIIIYNHDDTAYLLNAESGDIKDITIYDWDNPKEKYRSDYGVGTLYSYSEEDALYVAQGLETVYHVNLIDGLKTPIYESDRAIYGMASSPSGTHIAILVSSDLYLGSYADLVVIDAKGKIVSQFSKVAYMGHSDGWHFIYPVMWIDNDTITVPLVGSPDDSFLRGSAFIHYKNGLLSKEDSIEMPVEVVTILKSLIGEWDESQVIRVLSKPDDEQARYYAVFVAGLGSYLIDLENKKATLIGSGIIIKWTSAGEILVWHSTEGKPVDFVGFN